MAHTPHLFSIEEALRFGWDRTRNNLKPLLVIGAVGAFLGLVQGSRQGDHWLLGLLVQLLQTAVTLAFMRAALELQDGLALDLSRPAALLGGYLPFLVASILYGLIVAAGMVLLIVPGVLWGLKYAFTTFLVADGVDDPVQALRESARLTRDTRGHLFLFALTLFGLNILGAIPAGLGLFLTLPVSFIASAHVLRRLQAHAGARVEPAPRPPPLTPAMPH